MRIKGRSISSPPGTTARGLVKTGVPKSNSEQRLVSVAGAAEMPGSGSCLRQAGGGDGEDQSELAADPTAGRAEQ